MAPAQDLSASAALPAPRVLRQAGEVAALVSRLWVPQVLVPRASLPPALQASRTVGYLSRLPRFSVSEGGLCLKSVCNKDVDSTTSIKPCQSRSLRATLHLSAKRNAFARPREFQGQTPNS